MLLNDKIQFNNLLTKAATALDIPDHVYEDATLKYEEVGEWLAADDSTLKAYTPEIYVQGSFRLGTVVHPINDADEYDIDLVCHLTMGKEQTTQADLKEMVGARLKKHAELVKILNPSRRCWTLDYPAEKQMPAFHMDVLPAIPNTESPPTGLLLTDTELRLWQKSNPKAYAEWFYGRMKVIFQTRRAALAESLAAKVEDVPDWQVKTPLQIAVQILKRHRDIYFQKSPDVKPVSIIITTLAARAYAGEADVMEALSGIIRVIVTNWGKPGYVEDRNGRWWVENPVEPGENFADKWNEYPERREAFYKWLERVKSDFAAAQTKRTLNEAVETLTPVLGKRAVMAAARDLGVADASMLPAVINASPQVPALGDARHCQQPQWPVVPTYKASIQGDVYAKEHGRHKLWGLSSRPVPKGVGLKFTVKTNAPFPYEVKWQVVNTGAEALAHNSPRGDFYASDKGINGTRWESTAYAGTHWVEGFVIKGGQCVARTGKLYVKVR
ncbi:MAG: nucleotidyltransferase [Fimbriimonadaceae bacterium]|nr:nucleotidyltransferase [Fimbriimonadaceae bacterium]